MSALNLSGFSRAAKRISAALLLGAAFAIPAQAQTVAPQQEPAASEQKEKDQLIYDLERYARKGDLRSVRDIVATGKLDDSLKNYKWALSESARDGHKEVVEFFLSLETDKRKWDGEDIGHTMMKSCLAKNNETAKFLLQAKGKAVPKFYLDICLDIAAMNGDIDLAEQALAQGADVNYDGGSPLRNAAEYGHLPMVKFLVQKEADIYAYNKTCLCGTSNAMEKAAARGRLDVVKYFVEERKMPVNRIVGGKENSLPLRDSIDLGHASTADYLFKAGAKLEHEYLSDSVWIASLRGHWNSVRVVLSQGFDATDAYKKLQEREKLVSLHKDREDTKKAIEGLKALMDEYTHQRGKKNAPAPAVN